jgi:hypothetical protein
VTDHDALLTAIEGVDTGTGSAETLPFDELLRGLYPVPSQARVFNLDKILIIGGRGTGKTQVFRVLLSKAGRDAIVQATGVKLIHDVGKMVMVEAFSAGSAANDAPKHPPADAIEAVVKDEDIGGARRLWLGVCMARLVHQAEAFALLPAVYRTALEPLREAASSARRIRQWVDDVVERPFEILDALDRAATDRGLACVFTFDALDRAANDWDPLALLVGGLLSLALDVSRRNRSLRLKIFLRPDLESDAAKGFPDASKLRGYREELHWDRTDLYRLALKRMVGHPTAGVGMKSYLERDTGEGAFEHIRGLGWTPTARLDEAVQERVMARLAGKYMGANPRNGATYKWIPNHLADALRLVSPRSFLVALRTAAAWMRSRPTGSRDRLLTPASLEEGVRAASLQRVEELAEDFPWVQEVDRRLKGLLVPAAEGEVISRLKRCELSPPQKGLRSTDPRSMLDQLVALGVFLRDPDGRCNVPDLYRVAMDMKRRGGIRLAR